MALPRGRPSEYTEETALALCERMSMGESLTKICKSPGMPSKTSVLRWLARFEDFRIQYAKSRELSQDAMAEEYFEILDETPPKKPDGSVDSGWVKWTQNRADARKWYLSKIAPKRYGDKQEIKHSGGVAVVKADSWDELL